jgi:hypothetical protein
VGGNDGAARADQHRAQSDQIGLGLDHRVRHLPGDVFGELRVLEASGDALGECVLVEEGAGGVTEQERREDQHHTQHAAQDGCDVT